MDLMNEDIKSSMIRWLIPFTRSAFRLHLVHMPLGCNNGSLLAIKKYVYNK